MNCQKAYKNMRKSIKSWQRQNKQTTIDMATIEFIYYFIYYYFIYFYLFLIFLVPKASPIPRARKKLVRNVNAGMTISPGGLPPLKLLWSKIALNRWMTTDNLWNRKALSLFLVTWLGGNPSPEILQKLTSCLIECLIIIIIIIILVFLFVYYLLLFHCCYHILWRIKFIQQTIDALEQRKLPSR